jgi:hypothetical protein
VALSANLEASFGADGFDLEGSFSGLAGIFSGVDLPSLSLDTSGSPDLGGFSLGGVSGAVGNLDGLIGGALDGFPDVTQLLAPLSSALSIPELVGGTDFAGLAAQLESGLVPQNAGLAELVSAANGLGSLPGLPAVTGGLATIGVDLRAPGALLGGTAGGIVSLVQLLGALMGVEATSAEIERRISLSADLLGAERLAALIGRIHAAGGASLAALLTGVDPDDPGVADIVAGPIEAYAGLVRELVDTVIRGVAFAEATVVHADFAALTAELALATAGLQESALPPVRTLVESAAPAIAQVGRIQLPDIGPDTLVGTSADLAASLQTLVDSVAPTAISGLIEPILDPVLAPIRAVNDAIQGVVHAVDAAFQPIRDALHAIDLTPVHEALSALMTPVQDAIDAISSLLEASQTDVQNAVDDVVSALTPVQTALTAARDAIATPFNQIHVMLAALDLAALQETLQQTIGQVASAVGAAPVRPVFDVASGVMSTAADALSIVPRSLLPDDVKSELDAACAQLSSLDLEATRTLLHQELDEISASIDASALDAVQAGYQAVKDFVASIDPAPLIAQLESQEFAALEQALDAIDPTTLLAGPLAALDTVRHALDGIDIASVLKPVDDALDTVEHTIESLDPAALVAPIEDALSGVRTAITDTLKLDEWTAQLEAVDTFVASFLDRFDPSPLLTALQSRWSALLAPLRDAGPSIGGSLLGGLLGPGAGLSGAGGFTEVLAWIRGVRSGSDVVHARLARAAGRAASAGAALGGLDLPGVSRELTDAHAALADAVAALPDGSLLRGRLEPTITATDPRNDLATVTDNLGRVVDRFGEASTTISATTPPDRSEVALMASGLATAFAPATAPLAAKGREALRILGIDSLEHGLGPAFADALESIGPGPLLGPFAAVVQSLLGRLEEFVHDGVVAPLTDGVGQIQELTDALSVTGLLAGVDGVRSDLLGLVDAVRPENVLSEVLGTFDNLRTTLHDLDPLAPIRIAVDTLKSTVETFTREFAPSTLLAPVVTVYDDLAALVGAFDVEGLLEPVLTALHELERQIDGGMDEVIDALEKVKAACNSPGGPIPGLDLSVAASVDVGGALGL